MGDKGQDTYEVWAKKTNDAWSRIVEAEDGDDIFKTDKRALAAAGAASEESDIVEVVVIKRIPIARLNGAGRVNRMKKFKLVENGKNAGSTGTQEKKEAASGNDVQRGSSSEGHLADPEVQHKGGEGGAGGSREHDDGRPVS